MSLDEVAARTRINRKYLDAIETGDRSSIPGGFFFKSFVRQYAAALAPDDPDFLQDVEEALAAEQPATPPAHADDEVLKALAALPVTERSSSMSANAPAATYVILLVLVLIGCTGLYMWWHRAQQAEASVPAPVQQQTQPIVPAPGTQQTSLKEPAAQRVEPASPPPVAAKPAPAAVAPVSPAPAPAPATGPITLEITATELTWFSVTADGKTVFANTMQPGESKTFTAQDSARLRVGNAGGLTVKFNGQATPPIGPKGQVRTVVVTPTKYQILVPNPDDEG